MNPTMRPPSTGRTHVGIMTARADWSKMMSANWKVMATAAATAPRIANAGISQ